MKKKIRVRSKRSLFACLIILATFIVPTFSYASTYYVSTNGNNANSGTQAAPFRTIKFAFGRLVAGDTLFIRGGTYLEMLESHQGTNFPSGTSWANPVTVAAFPEEQVTLVGTMSIGLETPLTQYVIFDGITIDATNLDSGVSLNGGTRHIRFINGEVKNAMGASGINMSYFQDANPGGATSHEFINMRVHHNGDTKGLDHGFYIRTSGNLVENCQIHDNAAIGIDVFVFNGDPRPSNNIFRNNQIWNNGVVLYSGSGISISRSDGNLIYNNILWNNLNGININVIGPNADNKVYNNTVYGSTGAGISVYAGSTDTQVINNISYNNGTNLLNEGTNSTFSMNLTTNPYFVDSAKGDFHLFVTSPAISNGKPLEEVKTDFAGFQRSLVSPTLGAYENSSLLMPPPQKLRLVTK